MNCLMDNDVILKLAATQFLDDWQKIAVKDGEIRVTVSAKYFFRKKKELPEKYGEAAVKAAIAFAEKTETVSGLNNPRDYESLIELSGIDSGEALLFAAALNLPDYLMVSGDKVALKTLQAESRCKRFRMELKGRIIAFEQVILALIGRGNFAVIRERIVAAEKTDTVMQVAFGLGLETTKEKATEALEYYIKKLRQETGSLLMADHQLELLLAG